MNNHNSKCTYYVVLLIVIASIAISLIAYPQLPQSIASHWGIQGEVNGYMSKSVGAWFMPILIAGLSLLLLIVPKIDPFKENYKHFAKQYQGFVIVMTAFFLAIHTFMILWNLGYPIHPGIMFPVSLSALIYYLSILIERAKRNWFVGIRTPWTLSSDEVWDKTHALGAKLFKILAVLMFISAIAPLFSFYIVIGGMLIITIWLTGFSYWLYQKEKSPKN